MRRLILVALILTLACKAQRSQPKLADLTQGEAATRAVAVQSPPPPAEAKERATLPEAAGRMIIRNANLSVVVRDAAGVLRRISAEAEAHGGYVADSRQWKERDQVRATATIRVPDAQLQSTLASIRALAVRVESENVSAQDVSQEFTDLAARLRNLRAAETELRELLKTVRERTRKASEIMEIYDEITKVRGEIESIQGRMQYLSQMTALSTMTVELIPDALAAPVVETGWQPLVTVRAASRALVNTAKVVVEAAIWIAVYLVPIALFLTAVTLAVRSGWIRLRRAQHVNRV